jgi:hypothetical protein
MGNPVILCISQTCGNSFYNNTYIGSWQFLYGEYNPQYTFSQWQAKGQDTGSTIN